MHIFCSWLHAAATVCLLHQRLADAAAGADAARGAVHPSVVVSVVLSQTAPCCGPAAWSWSLAPPRAGAHLSGAPGGQESVRLSVGGPVAGVCCSTLRSHRAPFSGNSSPLRLPPLSVVGW